MLPRKNSIATTVLTIGQILIGIIDVCAPVKRLNTAKTISIIADILYTIIETGVYLPPKIVTNSTSKPMKQRVRPSAIHSIVMIRLLSCDISPKPVTIDFVGTMWEMPHNVITAEPMYKSILSNIETSLFD